MTSIEEKLYYAMCDMGTTADEVYALLAGQNITGTHRSHGCPVSKYLSGVVGETVSVQLFLAKLIERSDLASVLLTQAINDFVMRFDHGKYPELCKLERKHLCNSEEHYA